MNKAQKKRHGWSLKFEPEACAILGLCLFTRASLDVDQKEHADLVFSVGNVKVGFRIQRSKYLDEPHFTIRERSQSGRYTEWSRVMEGIGPELFLGAFEHAEKPGRIGVWFLIDVPAFVRAPDRSIHRRNHDGSTFRRINLGLYPPEIVLHSGFMLKLNKPKWSEPRLTPTKTPTTSGTPRVELTVGDFDWGLPPGGNEEKYEV